MKDEETIDFGCYGKASTVTLRNSIQLTDEQFWKELSLELEMKDILQTIPASSSDYIFSKDHHKFTLTFWKAILDWQEGSPGKETHKYVTMLGHTIQKYLTWDLADPNAFKILKFLSAGILKIIKHVPEEFQSTLVPLVYTLYVTGSDLDHVSNFVTLFRNSLEKLLEHHVGRDSGCHGNNGRPDTESCLENDVVQLLLLLGCNKISVIGDVFTALHAAVPWAVQAFVIYPSGKSSRPVSLIHYTIFKLSGMCTHIKSLADLQEMESVLIQSSLSYYALVFTVASTTLVFMARLASPAYVSSLLHLICSLVSRTNCPIRARNLRALISRLFPLGDPSLMTQLQPLLDSPANGLFEFSTDDSKRKQVINDLQMQWSVSNIKSDALIKIAPCSTTLVPLLKELAAGLSYTVRSKDNQSRLDNIHGLVVALLQSIARNWKSYRCDVMKLFEVLDNLMQLYDILISGLVLDILVRYSSFKSDESSNYCAMCATLISKLLKSENPYISFKCLHTVATFAKMTPHPEVLTSLAKDPAVKSQLSHFFQTAVLPPTRHLTRVLVGTTQSITCVSPGARLILRDAINSIAAMKNIPLHSKRRLQQITSNFTKSDN